MKLWIRGSKMKRGFNKIYEFPKQTLDYSTLYRSRYF